MTTPGADSTDNAMTTHGTDNTDNAMTTPGTDSTDNAMTTPGADSTDNAMDTPAAASTDNAMTTPGADNTDNAIAMATPGADNTDNAMATPAAARTDGAANAGSGTEAKRIISPPLETGKIADQGAAITGTTIAMDTPGAASTPAAASTPGAASTDSADNASSDSNMPRHDPDTMRSMPTTEIEELALLGNNTAQMLLSARYYTGANVEHNWRLSFVWLNKAAQNGIQLAQYLIGHFHYAGIGTVANSDEAKFWYQVAADGGSEQAKVTLLHFTNLNPDILHEQLSMYMYAIVVGKHEQQLLPTPISNYIYKNAPPNTLLQEQLAQARHFFQTGISYDLEYATSYDPAIAFTWYLRAAQLGYAPAQYRVGIALADGNGTATDTNQAPQLVAACCQPWAPYGTAEPGKAGGTAAGSSHGVCLAQHSCQ